MLRGCLYYDECITFLKQGRLNTIKVAYTVNDADGKTLTRELAPLESIRDHNLKYLIIGVEEYRWTHSRWLSLW